MEPRLRGSVDSTSSTRGIRCGGAYLLPRVYTNTGSCIPVLSLLPSSEFCSGALCSGLDCSRFSIFRWVCIVRFSLLWGRSFVPAATWGFAFSFVGFARKTVYEMIAQTEDSLSFRVSVTETTYAQSFSITIG